MGYSTIMIIIALLGESVFQRNEALVYVGELGSRIPKIKQGMIRGRVVEFPPESNLQPVEIFTGIQYAWLRAGYLRFLPPATVVEKWQDIRNADKSGNVCTQRKRLKGRELLPDGYYRQLERLLNGTMLQGTECLSLNIYVPRTYDKNDTTPFPVMVFVHGESYDMGTGNAYDGSVLASFGRVIVVTVNYRLGVLGFLSTGDRDANGNQALLDLLAVLTWIKENIASFDGDPNSVTLIGHGHGAALVNFLTLNRVITVGPSGNNLFQRAILQSGSAYSTWATSVDPVTCAQKLAINVNCSDHMNKSSDLIQCLKNRTADELVENAPIPPKYFSCFAPTLDNVAFFPENSIEKLIKRRSGSFTNINIMFGITKNEAYSYLKQSELESGISYFRKSQMIRTYVQNVYKYHRQKIFEILDHQYSEWDRMQDDTTRRENIMELISDGQYVAPLVKMAQEHSKYADTYFYSFGYSTQSESDEFPKWSSGVHGDELPYIFGAPLVDGVSPFPSKYKKYEKGLSAFMMRMWTNFAKSGNPNYPMKTSGVEDTRYSGINWPKYQEDRQLYLQIGRRTLSRDHYRGKQIALWLDLIPKINVEDSKHMAKPDSAEHNLFDPKNMSTFDEPNRLMNHFRLVGQPFLYKPSMTPTQNDGRKPSSVKDDNDSSTSRSSVFLKNTTGANEYLSLTSSPEPGFVNTAPIAKDSVPLSITVAVGCTLLFFNILIFVGVYYQKMRIKKLKEIQKKRSLENADTVNQKYTNKQDANRHETTNLMPTTDNHSNKQKQIPNVHSAKSAPNVKSKYYDKSNSNMSSDNYSYSPVPTNSPSPVFKKNNVRIETSPSQTSRNMDGEITGRPPDLHDADVYRLSKKYDKSSRKSHFPDKGMTIV